MPDGGVSDAQIAAMSASERRELITRLERPIGELLSESVFVRMRRVHLLLMAGAIVGLIPWTRLPGDHVARQVHRAQRILRLTANRLYALGPGMPLWRIPLLP